IVYCITNNHHNITKYLQEFYENDYYEMNSKGNTILHIAASKGAIFCINEILKLNNNNNIINKTNNDGQTAASLAALNGFWKSLDILLENNAIIPDNYQTLYNQVYTKGYTETAKILNKNSSKFGVIIETIKL